MKRSTSRASKISIDAQDFLENPLPGVSDSEWQEFLEKEETDMFILNLREEIIQKCMNVCYKNYLEKQAVCFTVHCAYLAWCKVINIYSMFRDPGDTEDPEVKESWKPDPEPPPSLIDSWGVECIESVDPSLMIKKKDEKVSKTEFKPVERKLESLESCSFISDLFVAEEGEYLFFPEFVTPFSSSKVSREPSIFTRTLSMSRESLPLIQPLALSNWNCDKSLLSKKKKRIKKAD